MTIERVGEEVKASACSYVMLMLLQRLESSQKGFIDEMIAGALADKSAVDESGSMTESIQNVFTETLRLLRQAKG
ncbi:hypothetical protein [Rhodoferax sp. GW822-FHT02A01]|uniref:hypothetical protein n=1 Tax=Rhodoferax sp. GW822-FHT02A01 TaxID=3141537 RepID=UPI00315D0A9F